MELIVEGKGTFLGKHQGRLRVTRAQQTLTEVPLIHLKQIVVIDSGVAISSDVIRICSDEGIPIHFLDRRGTAIAGLYSAGLTGTVLTRRAQLRAYDTVSGVQFAKSIVTGKLENQAALLRYMAKYRKDTSPSLYEEMTQTALGMRDFLSELAQLHGETIEAIREQILSVEGRAAQRYWNTIAQLIPAQDRK